VPNRSCIATMTSVNMATGLADSLAGCGSVWETTWMVLEDGFDGSILITAAISVSASLDMPCEEQGTHL
jgi:hypothetical protein